MKRLAVLVVLGLVVSAMAATKSSTKSKSKSKSKTPPPPQIYNYDLQITFNTTREILINRKGGIESEMAYDLNAKSVVLTIPASAKFDVQSVVATAAVKSSSLTASQAVTKALSKNSFEGVTATAVTAVGVTKSKTATKSKSKPKSKSKTVTKSKTKAASPSAPSAAPSAAAQVNDFTMAMTVDTTAEVFKGKINEIHNQLKTDLNAKSVTVTLSTSGKFGVKAVSATASVIGSSLTPNQAETKVKDPAYSLASMKVTSATATANPSAPSAAMPLQVALWGLAAVLGVALLSF